MKKALVCDWLTQNSGAEKCIASFNEIWSDFDIYSMVDFLSNKDRQSILKGKFATTSFLQNLPFAKEKFRNYFMLFPYAIESFDLSKYDAILSSSHCCAKGVLTTAEQLHLCYIHTPARYVYDFYFEYLEQNNIKGIKALFVKYFLHKFRIWDSLSVNRVDKFIANSSYVAARVKKHYNKEAIVVYPPVDTDKFALCQDKDDYYLTASRLVPYKKIDEIVRAFSHNKKRLLVVGDGEEMQKIKQIASPNIEILGYQDDKTLIELMQRARAFVFAAKEDFGIIPVEAQSCGTPVICFSKGGTKESIIDGESGVHFDEQNADSINQAVAKFELNLDKFEPEKIRNNALKFSKNIFENNIKNILEFEYEKKFGGQI